MSTGYSTDPGSLNSQAGIASIRVRDAMNFAAQLKAELDTVTDQSLLSQGMIQGDIDVIRSAVTDLADLAKVFHGQSSSHVTGTYDYTTFSKLLWGFQ